MTDLTTLIARVEAATGPTIYIASKTRHAHRWRALRDTGAPIISTWIDEAGPGESADLADLWLRCISEAAGASALVIYREPEDVLKGAWVELGAALAAGVPVYAVGCLQFTVAHHPGIEHVDDVASALLAALRAKHKEQTDDR